ncbi:MAG: hypothetical protein ACKPKO_63625, partial [Candidatus Fonsibacter sp.]
MKFQPERCLQAIQILQRRGREATLRAIRLMLLVWIRDNARLEVIRDVTVENGVSMEATHQTLNDYITYMSTPRNWIDTPMLLATSAVFKVQIVCISPEPLIIIIAAPLTSQPSLPNRTVANVGYVHFTPCTRMSLTISWRNRLKRWTRPGIDCCLSALPTQATHLALMCPKTLM